MSLTCYTAAGGKITAGIDGIWFPDQAQPKLMPTAEIEIDFHPDVDSPRITQLHKDGDPSIYALGEARLVPPSKTVKPSKDSCLIAVNLKEFWPTEDLGDESKLVVLEGSGHAIFKVQAGSVFMTSDGPALIWNPGAKPTLVDQATLAPATRAHAVKARAKIAGIRTLRVTS